DHKAGATASMGVILAKEGEMYNSSDNHYMIMKLKDGVRYEETSDGKVYNPRQRFTRYFFEETQTKFDMSSFQMKRTDEDLFRNHYAMLNLRQLTFYTDSVSRVNDSIRRDVFKYIASYYQLYNPYGRMESKKDPPQPPAAYKNSLEELIPQNHKMNVFNQALNQTRYIKDELRLKAATDAEYRLNIRRF